MQLPRKKKPGDLVLASDWNTLIDAIATRTPRPGSGLELVASTGGFAYSRPAPPSAPHSGLPPFAVIGIEKNGSTYLVTIKEGWVIERISKSGDGPVVKFHIPEAADKGLDSIPRPQIGMSIGDTLWCRIKTGITGEINAPPDIFPSAGDQNGTHHFPEDPEGSGGEGTYLIKLFKLEDDGGTPIVKVYQQSDIEHWSVLWTGENLGGGSRVFKEHAEGENIYYFRTIHHRDAKRQIEVIEEGDLIRVWGNEKEGSLVILGDESTGTTLLEWEDGLITSEGEKKIAVREYTVCDDGTPKAVKFLILE